MLAWGSYPLADGGAVLGRLPCECAVACRFPNRTAVTSWWSRQQGHFTNLMAQKVCGYLQCWQHALSASALTTLLSSVGVLATPQHPAPTDTHPQGQLATAPSSLLLPGPARTAPVPAPPRHSAWDQTCTGPAHCGVGSGSSSTQSMYGMLTHSLLAPVTRHHHQAVIQCCVASARHGAHPAV